MAYTVSSVLSLISHVHSKAQSFLQEKMSQRGLQQLSSSHGFILFCLAQNGSMTMGELSRKINRDKSTATVLVRKLEKLGLVEIITSDEDSRKRIISLTDSGINFNQVTGEISSLLLENAFKNFNEDEKELLLKFLCRMSDNLS